ncbi:hypothetical protein [Pseudoalteromonas aurantia]|uniref:Tail fiber protein n=1 Tax=Pseudoalteromonas aurantia 208 TaxID=1314867 RepID=A0ABR9E9I4_9GAMM|nr:hypothetical protein [Pseudoalteromonas aurantia]MBE0367644.1 hypothetical protein [Pseudoalteromonas aurantia 208]
MTLEQTLTDVALEAAKHADSANKLIDDVKSGIDTINVVSQNHSVMDDWRTKTGKVAFKDIAGNSHEVDTLASIIADAEKINPNPHVMTKAQFNALRELRKKQYAGSGFVEWGKCYQPEGSWSPKWINNGLYQSALSVAHANELLMGSQGTNPQGISNTDYPESVIDGVTHKLSLINSNNLDLMNRIKFPAAPDGTKAYDSATGVVTEHTSAAEAFNERKNNLSAVADGKYDVTNSTFKFESTKPSGFSLSTGKPAGSAKIVVRVESSITKALELRDSNSPAGDAPLMKSIILEAGKTVDLTFNCTITSGGVYFRVPDPVVDQALKVHTFQVLPTTESVITSRKDLVFLESWHEKIADKDVVYPLGNVQYGATAYEGIALQNNLVAQGYSAFGEWDGNTTGHGAKWSSLSEASRVKLLANPAHNIYYDPEVKAYIQVRYRIRVVEGLGNDWVHTGSKQVDSTGWRMQYAQSLRVKPQGQHSSISKDFDKYTQGATGLFVGGGASQSYNLNPDIGSLIAASTSLQSDTNVAHDGKCYAVPIALVQRMNQGAYHPTYNPMGCARWNRADGTNGYNFQWYASSVASYIKSTMHAFINGDTIPAQGGFTNDSGKIDSNNTGRPDQYKYHDAIYAGQVEDLRLNANKLDVNQLREETMRKAVAGTLRGKGKVPFTNRPQEVSKGEGETSACYINAVGVWDKYWGKYNQSAHLECQGYIILDDGRVFRAIFGSSPQEPSKLRAYWANFTEHDVNYAWLNSQSADDLNDSDFRSGNWHIVGHNYFASNTEFDSLPWVDIIGDPSRVAATFPKGVIGQWIPELPREGVGSVPLNRKCTNASSPLSQVFYTVDNGETWLQRSQSFSKQLNTLVLDTTIDNPHSVILVHYEASSDFTQASNNSVVIGDVGDVFYTTHSSVGEGNNLQGSLTGNAGKATVDPAQGFVPHLGAYRIIDNALSTYGKYAPRHAALPLASQGGQSPAVKAMSTITEKDGLLYLQLHGAELKYDAPEYTVISNAMLDTNLEPNKHYLFKLGTGTLMDGGLWYCNRSMSSVLNSPAWYKKDDGTIGAINVNGDPTFLTPVQIENWGDDQTISIVNGEDVKTDLNGNTVEVFCHHTQMPIGIAHN